MKVTNFLNENGMGISPPENGTDEQPDENRDGKTDDRLKFGEFVEFFENQSGYSGFPD